MRLVGESGAARFRSNKNMCAFMTKNKQYEAMGKTVFAIVASIRDTHHDKTKSIRKMVRAIIEKVGAYGRKVKEEQMRGTSYPRGRVYFQRKGR